jgi:hypothetical protein
MEKLVYLRKYAKDIEIINYFQLNENEKSNLPIYWCEAFKEKNMEKTINIILSEWEKYDYQFQSTLSYLHKNLVRIELIKTNNELSLLYSIKNASEKEVYYIGKNPKTLRVRNSLIKLWGKLPNTIRDIYEKLHNGWFYFASGSNGLSSIDDIIILNNIEWGILEQMDIKTLPYKLENCIGLFHNGAGSYVCYDIKSKDKNKGFIWFSNKKPKNNIEMWAVIDEWTKMSIEE